MLPKANRLKKKSDIEKIFIKGDSYKVSSLICKYIQNTEGYNRPCFTIAKKLKLNAVTRNRLRRQLAYAYKKTTQELNQKVYYDFVFILYKIPPTNSSRFNYFCQDFNLIYKHLTAKNV